MGDAPAGGALAKAIGSASLSGGTLTLGPLSGALVLETGDFDPPAAPTGLSATAVSASQIDLAWTAGTDNVGVDRYRVVRDGAQDLCACHRAACQSINECVALCLRERAAGVGVERGAEHGGDEEAGAGVPISDIHDASLRVESDIHRRHRDVRTITVHFEPQQDD